MLVDAHVILLIVFVGLMHMPMWRALHATLRFIDQAVVFRNRL